MRYTIAARSISVKALVNQIVEKEKASCRLSRFQVCERGANRQAPDKNVVHGKVKYYLKRAGLPTLPDSA
jgi:hypothetical protein